MQHTQVQTAIIASLASMIQAALAGSRMTRNCGDLSQRGSLNRPSTRLDSKLRWIELTEVNVLASNALVNSCKFGFGATTEPFPWFSCPPPLSKRLLAEAPAGDLRVSWSSLCW
jgi:hypothetical protein